MNKAALRDLEIIEAYHRREAETHRFMGREESARWEEAKAETVRVCIVTVQAAETREPDNADASDQAPAKQA